MTATAARPIPASKVRVLANRFNLHIIVSVEKKDLAWAGTRWVQITGDGAAAGDVRPLSFTTVEGAASYAADQGFQVEQG